jgi:hypothetical protein
MLLTLPGFFPFVLGDIINKYKREALLKYDVKVNF